MKQEIFQAENIKHRLISVNGIRLHMVEAGKGPLIILLHGFPQNWWCWKQLIPVLATAGYRVVAPDLRGYNLSDQPEGIRSYRLDSLARDISELIEALGEKRAVLIGHDWGGVVAWTLAHQHPRQILKLIILNAPHPIRFIQLLGSTRQLFRSWYVFAALIPKIPEAYIRWNEFLALRSLFRDDPLRSDAFDHQDIDCFIDGFNKPGALTSALNYYRAGLLYGFGVVRSFLGCLDIKTLLLWGVQDPYLDPRLLKGLDQWVSDLTIKPYEDGSHWLIAEHPERIAKDILAFLDA